MSRRKVLEYFEKYEDGYNYGYTTNVNEKVEADMDLNISVDYGDDE